MQRGRSHRQSVQAKRMCRQHMAAHRRIGPIEIRTVKSCEPHNHRLESASVRIWRHCFMPRAFLRAQFVRVRHEVNGDEVTRVPCDRRRDAKKHENVRRRMEDVAVVDGFAPARGLNPDFRRRRGGLGHSGRLCQAAASREQKNGRGKFSHGVRCRLTKKAEPPPTRDVNRDSGTGSSIRLRSEATGGQNGGWLWRLRPHGSPLAQPSSWLPAMLQSGQPPATASKPQPKSERVCREILALKLS